MPERRLRAVKSWSNARAITAVRQWLSHFRETLVVLPCQSAGESLAQNRTNWAGVHRITLTQLASSLARPVMAEHGLAPIDALGVEAVSARVVFAAQQHGELGYYGPVASSPGFARALARTLGELRLAGVRPDDLAGAGAPAPDPSRLLERYQAAGANQS